MTTLYLDMDGVVADFNEYAHRTLRVPASQGIYPDDVWQKLAANPRIYRDLIPITYAGELVATCFNFAQRKQYGFMFLTAVPKGNDVPWAFYDKVEWARKYFPNIPVMFGPFSKDKHQHCQPGDILIDDRSSNIEEWRAAGGIAIHHVDFDTTITVLNSL
jgi:5'(3')-deoxyribonucleotidase